MQTTNPTEALDARLARGEVVLIDGGMGTELEVRGVPMDNDAWAGRANLTHKDVVRQAHEDFIKAGAEILITNTFPTVRFSLENAGLGDEVERINRQAVEAAIEARAAVAEHPVYIGGAMSLFGVDFAEERGTFKPTEKAFAAAYDEQATILAEAGIDFFILETIHPFWASGLTAAVNTGLPVWLAPVVRLSDDGEVSAVAPIRGLPYPLRDMIREMDSDAVHAVTVMHSSIEATEAALELLARDCTKPFGAYPHWGTFEMPHWTFEDISPADFATAALGWADTGATLVGGCCGIRPDHIAALRDRLAQRATPAAG